MEPLEDVLFLDPNEDCRPLIDCIVPRKYHMFTTEGEGHPVRLFDEKRWACVSRPAYLKSSGLSTVVSCWNFLFSRVGGGDLELLSQETALGLLGIDTTKGDLEFGTVGNKVIVRWFLLLCEAFGVKGMAKVYWKVHGKGANAWGSTEEVARGVCDGLENCKNAFVYHCFAHYLCLLGYEKSFEGDREEMSLICGDTSNVYPPVLAVRWDDVVVDLSQQNPSFFDIRYPEKGIQTKMENKQVSGSNVHCLISLERA